MARTMTGWAGKGRKMQDELFARTKEILNPEMLRSAEVVHVGLGSIGGTVALELAKCGVPVHHLVDFDVYGIENVVRHACGGFGSVGRRKTELVAEAIKDRNPDVQAIAHQLDAVDQADALWELIGGSSLAVVSTDTVESRRMINSICLELDKPLVVAGCFERARGGEVFRRLPGKTPCLGCFEITMERDTSVDRHKKRTVDYTTGESQTVPEPGLSVDIGFIALLAAKVCISTLVEGKGTTVPRIEANYVCFWNDPPSEDFEPLKAYFYQLPMRRECLVHPPYYRRRKT